MQHLDDRSAEPLVGGNEFIHTLGVVGGQRFLIDFGVNFLPVGTPGASRAPLGDQVVSQTDF